MIDLDVKVFEHITQGGGIVELENFFDYEVCTGSQLNLLRDFAHKWIEKLSDSTKVKILSFNRMDPDFYAGEFDDIFLDRLNDYMEGGLI